MIQTTFAALSDIEKANRLDLIRRRWLEIHGDDEPEDDVAPDDAEGLDDWGDMDDPDEMDNVDMTVIRGVILV